MTGAGLSEGSPEPLGVTPTATGVNVAVFSANATAIEFCLFDDRGDRELRRVQLPERTGDVFHGHFEEIGAGARYGLRAHGPFAPAAGFRFNPAKLLLDPYATSIDRPLRLHKTMFGSLPGEAGIASDDSAPAMPKAIVGRPESAGSAHTFVRWEQTLIYELHVRGFTMRREEIPAALRGTFAGLAHPASINHLVRFGVTSVEIMPAAAWIEEWHLAALGLSNYWGYNPVAFMTPDPRLAPGGWPEVRATVAALAAAGIETIVDVVLNHSGEGDAFGPTVSLRGLDNSTYYRLVADNPAAYVDDAGCGNILALDRPPVLRLAMDTLRTWAGLAGVHGFRFDLATTLGRRPQGFDPAAPLLAAIAQDPVLRTKKLIAEPWDVGSGGYRLGQFFPEWGEWNDQFRDDVRRFWRGDPEQLGALATRLSGSSDLLAAKRRPSRGVNFITAHDGLTLADLVAYERKHNEANGEGNRDGTDSNFSWNHGVEGPAANDSVNAARLRDQRSLLATLLMARGTPMLSMGAELGQTQHGNNNAYAQDNETSWLDWARADSSLIAWTARLSEIRRNHPVFREDRFLTGKPAEGCLVPDVLWLRPDGQAMSDADWGTGPGDAFVVVLSAACGDRLCLVFNRGEAPATVALPEPCEAMAWRLLADSAAPDDRDRVIDSPTMIAAARSAMVFDEAVAGRSRSAGRRGATEALDRLSVAAGITQVWHEVDGTRHVVSVDTKRALLAAMGLPAGDERQAREALERLSEERDRRAPPCAVTAWENDAAVLSLPIAPGLNRRPVSLTVTSADGGATGILVREDEGQVAETVAPDGRTHQLWRVVLPQLQVGRYRVERDDMPGLACALTIAPRRCFSPPALTNGGRRFGLSAQLYSLRREGDQGIGDFTTLAELGEIAARAGAATVAINPLHALFPDDRKRASPYQPSDRRFFDPIYLDIDGLEAGVLAAAANVDYAAVWAAKKAALERSFAGFDTDGDLFRSFVAAGGGSLRKFAIFSAIAETRGGEPWRRWPDRLAEADSPAVEAFALANVGRVLFHQYLQYLCARQWVAAADRAATVGLGLGIIRDLAVGAAPDGAEVWAQTSAFAGAVSIGAPPDPLAPQGQVWGLPPPNPLEMERTGFAAFAELLRANMSHAGGLRIDHVMGLSRLFWVPEGADGADGAYVAYPLQQLLAQVTLESTAARCPVIGEDLGTVPEGLRDVLAQAGLLSYRVLLLEREGVGFRPPSAFPQQALACVTTHDLPTLVGWWENADIEERQKLGLVPAAEAPAALAYRDAEKVALVAALNEQGIPAAIDEANDPPPEVVAGVHDYVARSPAALVLAQVDDLAGERVAVNLPGTDSERPNWRRRLRSNLDGIFQSPGAGPILNVLRRRQGLKPPSA